MTNKKKKKVFLKGYTPFQKFWIVTLLAVIAVSLALTLMQGLRILFSVEEEVIHKPKATAETTALPEEDTTPWVLKESEDAGREYVEETLFLGDSNTVRFMNFTDADGKTYTTKQNTIAVVGMGINAMNTLQCMQFSTGTFTMTDSVRIMQPKRVIVTFGTNNLTGVDNDASKEQFIAEYTRQIKLIQDAYPTVDIIINSIPPIAKNTVYRNLKPLQIKHWNEGLEKMCEENDWHYLNSYEVLADQETGWAKENMLEAADGLHFAKAGLSTLFEYIRTHAYITEDDRPALNPIPTIIGPKTTLYDVDPLSGSAFSEDVLNPNGTDTSATPTPSSAAETEQTGNTENQNPVTEEDNEQPSQEQPIQNETQTDTQPTSNEGESVETPMEGPQAE